LFTAVRTELLQAAFSIRPFSDVISFLTLGCKQTACTHICHEVTVWLTGEWWCCLWSFEFKIQRSHRDEDAV